MTGYRKEKQKKVHLKKTRVPKKSKTSNPCNCLPYVISFIRFIYDFIVSLIFYYVYKNTPSKTLPPVDDLLVLDSCTTIVNKIKNKEVTCRHVVECFIKRIEKVNPILNAVVDTRFDKALAEADEYDKLIELANTEEKINLIFDGKPLFGIPFTSKESTGAKGMAWTLGLVSRIGMRSKEDAEVVKSLKTAGAILLGVTNVPEINLWCETRNKVYGQTNNPYNTNHSAGGSSGGEASIVSACGSPLGLGSDIGGSARIPAFNCGLFGHKLTTGFINTKGMTFRKGTEKQTMVSAGPITKYAEDLTPAIKAVLGPEKSLELKIGQEVDLSSLKYYYVDKPNDARVSPISDELQIILDHVIEDITSITELPPLKVKFSGTRYSYSLWRHSMTKEESDFCATLGNNQTRVSVWSEILKTIVGRSNHSLAAVLKLIDLQLPKVNAVWADAEIEKLSNEISTLLGDDSVLFFPSSPTTAKRHCEPFLHPYNFAYWAIFNVLKLPVTQVPLGLGLNGLPLGIQVVAGMNQDRLCVAVAKHLELTFGGWKPPFTTSTMKN
ncbi:fatty-acid amide hydrolase 2-A [Acyrthosiphon pisum]|uniref:Amidase domain-containing protein n=1 Tax=Acyrthosiphon pisum TaxID=7029 RepID=A0A8R2B918_ACYPI|nr:fatty-acid amide hydrolase 2-A [Acyrthosiphon pisum]|eukprot:XP_008187748.1 PREDICTED: fatty-acid amide hydrolase 2-A [Acyrthosiphon pisum]